MSSDKKKKDFVDSTFRKKWDKDYYEQRAKDRDAGLLPQDDELASAAKKQKPLPPSDQPLKFFKAREEDLNLSQKIGKTNVIAGVTPLSKQGGFYCETCDCLIKDSSALMDHVNGKKRRLMGISMRVETSSLSQVKDKLRSAKQKLEQQKSQPKLTEEEKRKKEEQEYRDMFKELEEKEAREEKEKKEQKKKAKKDKQQEEEKEKEQKQEQEQEQKNNENNDNSNSNENNVKESVEEVEKKNEEEISTTTTTTTTKSIDDKPTIVEYEDDEEDYSAMGLPGGFGTSKKN
eukprot:gene391-492_t